MGYKLILTIVKASFKIPWKKNWAYIFQVSSSSHIWLIFSYTLKRFTFNFTGKLTLNWLLGEISFCIEAEQEGFGSFYESFCFSFI